MASMFKITTIVFAAAGLSACGGSSIGALPPVTAPGEPSITPSQKPTAQQIEARGNAFLAQAERVSEMSPSSLATMNNALGRATFDGAAGILVNPSIVEGELLDAETTLLGDATINVNFRNGTLSGDVTNIIGTDSAYNDDNYTGSVQIKNGSIGDFGVGTFVGEYEGTVRGNRDTIALDGDLFGAFAGNPSVDGLLLYGEGTSNTDGYRGTSIITLVAER